MTLYLFSLPYSNAYLFEQQVEGAQNDCNAIHLFYAVISLNSIDFNHLYQIGAADV